MTATITQVVKQFQQEWTTQLAPAAILGACHRIGYTWRDRLLNPVITIQLFFVHVLNGNTACTHLRHLTKVAVSASAYCQARAKLPLTVFTRLLRTVSDRLQPDPLDEGQWVGHRPFLVDGSSCTMPDTPELHDHCGHPGGQRPGCGFPVAHFFALFHAGTGMLVHVLRAPLRTHDLSQVVALHPELRPGDVLVGDRGFCSSVHVALLSLRGVHGVLRMHQKHIVDCTPARPHVPVGQGNRRGHTGQPRSRWRKQLGPYDHIVDGIKPTEYPEWMRETPFAHLPESLTVRELRYRVQRPGCRVTTVTLVTTLLDAETYTVDALASLYCARWGIATNLGHLKTTMGLDVRTCKTVNGVRKERIVFALIDNVVRLVMWEAAKRQRVDVERISFIDAARWLASARDDEPLPVLVVHPHRPYRYEPRVRKRRPKPYSLMTKPRQELRKFLVNKAVAD
jgi:hypothetical protein